AWFGTAVPNGTEEIVKSLLDAVGPTTVRAAIMIETDSLTFFPSLEAQEESIRHVLQVHAQHPGYFRHDGKPVVFVWHPQAIWIGGGAINRDSPEAVEAWRSLRDSVDPDHASLWIAETGYAPYLEVFDGLFAYNVSAARDPQAALTPY